MIKRNEIFKYVKDKYDTEPEYLWSKYPGYAVLRHKSNNKWYGLIMNVPKEKLGLEGKEEIDIIDLKNYPELIGTLRNKKEIIPAYHMNKEHWVSVILNGEFPEKELFDLIDLSYEITK